jgi:hypothetical protein
MPKKNTILYVDDDPDDRDILSDVFAAEKDYTFLTLPGYDKVPLFAPLKPNVSVDFSKH